MRRATSRLSLFLYSVVVAIFVAGFLARYIHPRHAWWLQLIAIGLPYLAGAVAALTLPVFLSKHKKLRRFHVVVLLLVIARFPPWNIVGSGRPGDDDLRLLSYNAPGIQIEANQSVTAEMQALATRTNPHLITLQEVYWRYAFGRKAGYGRPDIKALVDNSAYDAAPDSIGSRVFTQQPVLSRVGIKTVELYEYKMTDDQVDPLQVLRAVTEWDDRELEVLNVHLASYGSQKPWHEDDSSRYDPWVWRGYMRRYRQAIIRRAWEAERVRDLAEAAERPFLITGDFNATPHNWTYRHIARGLRDAARDAGSGTGFTYHRRRPIARIDFVLASPEFVFTSAHTENGRTSDHRAVLVTMRWR